MDGLAVYGVGMAAILIALAVGLVVHAFLLWLVCRFMLGVPGATLMKCAGLALALTLTSVVMILLLFLFIMIPFIGPIVWLFLFFKALKATIEGVLDIHEGGWTILILYILVQFAIGWLMNQAG